MKKQITIFDIAKKADLSPSTVSRALRDHPKINISTRNKVKKIAKELNFKPNLVAQSLKNSKSAIIGVIVPEIKHEFFANVISGIEEIAYNYGYTIIVCQSNENYKREVIIANSLIQQRVAGVVASISQQTRNSDHFKEMIANDIPLVFFDRVCEDIETNKVIIDDYKCAYDAVSFLISRGYKKIAHLAGPKILEVALKRLNGYVDALKTKGYEIREEMIRYGGMNERHGYESMDALLKRNIIPDAIFTANTLVAIGAYLRIKEAGLKIPNDIAILGFANNEMTTLVDPPITIVDQPSFDMGKKAVEILMELIESGEKILNPKTTVLDANLIVRGST